MPKDFTKCFISYYWCVPNSTIAGFGNTIMGVPIELYKDKIDIFIADMEKQLSLLVSEIRGLKNVEVRILYFR